MSRSNVMGEWALMVTSVENFGVSMDNILEVIATY